MPGLSNSRVDDTTARAEDVAWCCRFGAGNHASCPGLHEVDRGGHVRSLKPRQRRVLRRRPTRESSTVARLSFIVPAHNVGAYVDRCLKSLLQPGADVEVLVIDDASTDGTPAMLRREAERDRRIRVITHEARRGPGHARNTGLALATAPYVWFVDADDWLLDGALEVVLDRLRDGVDIVFVDHVRTFENGRVAPSASHELLANAASPRSLTEWPEAVNVLHTPWNKILRTAFLEAHQLRFSSAPVYEDVSFTYRALLAAQSIVAVAVPCYAYRSGRAGSLTTASGAMHLAWAAEWDAALAAASAATPVVQNAIFDRMLWHGLTVLGIRNGRRVPLPLRPRFAGELRRLYRKHKPAGRHDLTIEFGRWPLIEVRVARESVSWALGRAASRLRRAASRR